MEDQNDRFGAWRRERGAYLHAALANVLSFADLIVSVCLKMQERKDRKRARNFRDRLELKTSALKQNEECTLVICNEMGMSAY